MSEEEGTDDTERFELRGLRAVHEDLLAHLRTLAATHEAWSDGTTSGWWRSELERLIESHACN